MFRGLGRIYRIVRNDRAVGGDAILACMILPFLVLGAFWGPLIAELILALFFVGSILRLAYAIQGARSKR